MSKAGSKMASRLLKVLTNRLNVLFLRAIKVRSYRKVF